MKHLSRLFRSAAMALLMAAAPVALAQETITVTTLTGVSAKGTVVSESKDHIEINSAQFGALRFMKRDLKNLAREAGAASNPGFSPDSGGGASPFGGAVANPFGGPSTGGGAAPNPFGSAAAAVAPIKKGFGGYGVPVRPAGPPINAGSAFQPGPAGPNPFAPGGGAGPDPFGGGAAPPPGGPNPFGAPPSGGAPAGPDPFAPPPAGAPTPAPPAGGGVNPFGFRSDPNPDKDRVTLAGAPTWAPREFHGNPHDAGLPLGDGEPRATAQEPPTIRPVLAVPKLAPRTDLPAVRAGFDAVLFGMTAEQPVEIKSTDADWAPAGADSQLRTGSEVRTNETRTSRLVLRGKKDVIRLPEQSHIQIEKMTDDSEEVVINLKRGSVYTEVTTRDKPDAFQIRTPELTAGVRGTRFRVDATEGASAVSVFEGVVHVTATATGAYVTLKANEKAVVSLDGQIMDLLAVPVDEQEISAKWDQWAAETTGGGGLVGVGPVGALSQRIAEDNAQWEATMQEHMRNVAESRYQDKLDEYAAAFMRYAAETGSIPTDAEGWSVLKFDPGKPGWSGPYVEGAIPPLDPFKRPLKYVLTKNPAGRVFGRVYSMWEDGRDQGGVNATSDRVSLVKYFELERFRDDPAVNPPAP